VVGIDDKPDGADRTAVLIGKWLNVEGKRIVIDRLRVIEHLARQIGQELVLQWTEVRVEEAEQ
jgi:hypothetical protein